MFGGAALGFLSWVLAMFVLIVSTYSSTGGTIDRFLPWLLGAVLVGAVALILWPRTRRLGEGLLLGFAIGLVVAGGICLPLVLGAG